MRRRSMLRKQASKGRQGRGRRERAGCRTMEARAPGRYPDAVPRRAPAKKDASRATGEPVTEPLSDNALNRRVKRFLREAPHACFVQVTPGLEDVLRSEMVALGIEPDAREDRGGVHAMMSVQQIMQANLWLRTASRVLLRVGNEFAAASKPMLFDHLRKLPWEVHIGRAGSYALRASARQSTMKSGGELEGVAHDAIRRRLETLGLHAQHDPKAPLEFHLRLNKDRAQVSLNTSGEHLHRRGERLHVGVAPIRETLAAAAALLALQAFEQRETGPKRPDVVVDPFCGSGTMLIEMHHVLTGRAPGLRRSFAFEHAAWHREAQWRRMHEAALAAVNPDPGARLYGFDIDPKAIEAAAWNVENAGVEGVELGVRDARELDLDGFGAEAGLALSNLPYGVRVGTENVSTALLKSLLGKAQEAVGDWTLGIYRDANTWARRAEQGNASCDTPGGNNVKIAAANGGIRVELVILGTGTSQRAGTPGRWE